MIEVRGQISENFGQGKTRIHTHTHVHTHFWSFKFWIWVNGPCVISYSSRDVKDLNTLEWEGSSMG